MIRKPDFEFGSYTHTHKYGKIDFFAINKSLTDYPSITFQKAIDLQACRTLDTVPRLDKIYENDVVILYKVRREMSDE
jgi:hypothetical protein